MPPPTPGRQAEPWQSANVFVPLMTDPVTDPPALSAETEPKSTLIAPFGARPAPIALIASDAATTAAFDAVSDELRQARRDGRLVQVLPLDAIVEDHLVRDRVGLDETELYSLIEEFAPAGTTDPDRGGRSWWRCLRSDLRVAAAGGLAPPFRRNGRPQVQLCPGTAAATLRTPRLPMWR